jgi:hypothetical protein
VNLIIGWAGAEDIKLILVVALLVYFDEATFYMVE